MTYTASILVQSSFDLAAYTVNSRLNQQARHDVERELLRNLLQQDDAFYIRRAPAEIMSRLGDDLQRVAARRQNITEGSATVLSIIATVLVLVTQSWLAAAIGLAISALGVMAAQPRLRKLRALFRDTMISDEQVKAAFEDTLQGAAEIQVSGLLARMLKRFDERQTTRDAIALRNADLTNRNAVYQKLTFTLGFIAILFMFVVTNIFGQTGSASSATGMGGGAPTAGLIVVLIATLPQLYFKFGELTQRLTMFQISGESVKRLLQYEAPPSMTLSPRLAPSGAGQEGAIVLSGVRYQFSGSETIQGGPLGISCIIPPRGMTGIVGPAGAGKSTLIRLILGRQKLLDGTIAVPKLATGGSPFVYLPQRPILFDARLRDNLFLGSPTAHSAALISGAGRFARLGLLDLVRQRGLDALPGKAERGVDLSTLRAGFRRAAEEALQIRLNALGPGHCSPRQMAIESQLACAVDQAALVRRLSSPIGREPLRSLAASSFGLDMAERALALVRQTAPMLTRAGNFDEYNRIAALKIDPAIFQSRMAALDIATSSPDGPLAGPANPILVALGLSARLEELDTDELPPPQAGARAQLEKLVAGISHPLEADRINPLLPWRENLLFAVPDRANIRRLTQVDRVLLDRLQTTSLDGAVIDSGLDYPVGRLGGRLSGGQQQLVALGRALLSSAPFLVLDEPSSAFHPQLRLDAIAVLREEARSRSVIVVTHDLELARACDQLLFVRDGALAAQGNWTGLVADSQGFGAWVAQAREAA